MTTTYAPRPSRTTAGASAQETLLALLDVELHLTRRMVDVAAAQREALIRSDLEAIPALARELEGLAGLVRSHEARRTEAVAALAGSPGATLTSIVPLFPAEARDQVLALRADLRGALAGLRALTEQNTGLIQQALTITEHGLRVFRAAIPATYGAHGLVTGPAGSTKSWQV